MLCEVKNEKVLRRSEQKSPIDSRMQLEENAWKNGHKIAGFFYTTLYIHLGHGINNAFQECLQKLYEH